MKKTSLIKITLLQVAIVTTIFLTASCTNNQRAQDTKEVAEEHNDAKFDDNKQERDAQFLVNAAEINLEEIQLGRLAQQKGTTNHVKELGKRMEDAHTKSLNELKVLARNNSISIPTSPTHNAQDAYKNLNEKSGTDFDKAYADMMVSSHKDAISTFEDASNDSYDDGIKKWATTSLASLRTHLDHSIESQKKFGDMYIENINE